MATDIQNNRRSENTALWTVFAIIVIAVLAYAAYAAYHRAPYGNETDQATVPNTTTNTTGNTTTGQ